MQENLFPHHSIAISYMKKMVHQHECPFLTSYPMSKLISLSCCCIKSYDFFIIFQMSLQLRNTKIIHHQIRQLFFFLTNYLISVIKYVRTKLVLAIHILLHRASYPKPNLFMLFLNPFSHFSLTIMIC